MTPNPEQRARVIALAGGKGGVGTTLLAANLAVQLARQGREVVLIDAAPDGASVHARVGVPLPVPGLAARLGPDPPPLEELLVGGSIPNLRVLPGLPEAPTSPAPPESFGAGLVADAAALPGDFVVVDAGSGRSRATRLAVQAADTLLLVTTPEPESLRGILRLQAAALFGALEVALGEERARKVETPFSDTALRGVLALLKDDSARHQKVLAAVQRRHFGLVLNQVRTHDETQAATRVGAVLSMLQAIIVDPVVTIEYDLSALQAVGEGRVVSQRYPNAPVSRGLERLAYSLISPAAPQRRRGGDRYAPVSTWHHYRLLALDPKASPREVQRHYEWIRGPFLAGGEAEAVASRAYLDTVLSRVEAAYRTLIFLENRREYDRQLVATGVLEPSDLRELRADEAVAGPPNAAAAREGAAAEATSVSPSPASDAPPSEAGAADRRRRRRRGSRRRRRRSLPESRDAAPTPASDAAGGGTGAAAAPDAHSAPAGPGVGRPYTGAALRALREKRRWNRDRIAGVTKIRVHQIEAIEDDRFQDLPVPVFLRGFLRAYALCLDLDPESVVKDYMDSYDAWHRMRA